MKQLLLDIAPPSPPTLANFVPGRNVELLQTLSNVIEGLERERFIYLWGRAGSGRSHLLHAIAGICMRRKMSAAYFSYTPETDFAASSEADFVTVDDVDRLSAKA